MSDERERIESDETDETGEAGRLESDRNEDDFEGHQLEVGRHEEDRLERMEDQGIEVGRNEDV